LKNCFDNDLSEGNGSWEKIASGKELRPGRPIIRIVRGEEIALFLIGENIHAITNVCPHQHAPVLAEGRLDGTHLECPMHGWKYDIVTGKGIEASGSLAIYKTKLMGGDIFIFLHDEKDDDFPW
jgi:3-phenylpropionate/trans-cinnamate dioxygenase ferredoxin component